MAELDPEGMMETSPPAWGKLSEERSIRGKDGNIPTCVGKTEAVWKEAQALSKHPHLRGENSKILS